MDDGVMLYFDSATYDPLTGTLSVKTVAPSRAHWSRHEYRDVPASVVADLLAAAPHGGEFIQERVAPYYAVRRIDERRWHPPVPPDPAWALAAAHSGAVRD